MINDLSLQNKGRTYAILNMGSQRSPSDVFKLSFSNSRHRFQHVHVIVKVDRFDIWRLAIVPKAVLCFAEKWKVCWAFKNAEITGRLYWRSRARTQMEGVMVCVLGDHYELYKKVSS